MLYISHTSILFISSGCFSNSKSYKKPVKADNRTYDQLTYTCKLSAKPIIQMRNRINILIKFPCYFKANQVKSGG